MGTVECSENLSDWRLVSTSVSLSKVMLFLSSLELVRLGEEPAAGAFLG